MASVLDRYGIKEVADVTFYELKDGKPAYPVLYCDTLKVSTIEQTADEATANGGKGNVALISWDYNKDINVTIEDALFSAKSMAILFGNGRAHEFTDFIMKTETFKATANASVNDAVNAGWKAKFEGPDGTMYTKYNPKFYADNTDGSNDGVVETLVKDKTYFCSYDLYASGSAIKIGASTFPGTYYVVGDTFARSQADGKDEFFQFIISKAKITSENTITMEADGDPSVFNMNLHVLRPESGDMMKLVKYDLLGGTAAGEDTLEIYHNHTLHVENEADEATDIAAAEAEAAAEGQANIKTLDFTIVIPGESGVQVGLAGVAVKPTAAATVTFSIAGLTANTSAFDGTTAMTIAADATITEDTLATVTVVDGTDIYKGTVVVNASEA